MSKRHPVFSQFTVEQLVHIERALLPFEHMLANATKPLPNQAFAVEVLTELKTKLATMIQNKDYDTVTGFDANEVLTIHTSLMVFAYGIQQLPDTSEKRKISREVEVLTKHFAPLVALSKDA